VKGAEKGAAVLIVDDDADLRRLLDMRLSAAGYRVATAASGEEALSRLAVERPRAVITDLRMPGIDGLQLFARIHAADPALPVIVLTAHGSIPDAVAATQSGVYGYLTKPFEAAELLALLARAVGTAPVPTRFADIITVSPLMRALLDEVALLGASGGTLFLDEIGDMPLPLQAKLLRVLQEREVRPLGATEAVAVDVRVVSATHRDLDAATAAHQFREDLYYRLNVVNLRVPPLRERREDIAVLAQHFVERLARKHGRRIAGFTPDALELLLRADWPGNIRQLMNVVEQCCALCTTVRIPAALVARALRSRPSEILSYAEAKEHFERDYLVQLMKLTGGQVTEAARLAQRNRTEFYRLLQKHGLSAALFKPADEN
jgi:DNA-binding NtrC family response regulator